jgi:hypothetical protein
MWPLKTTPHSADARAPITKPDGKKYEEKTLEALVRAYEAGEAEYEKLVIGSATITAAGRSCSSVANSI